MSDPKHITNYHANEKEVLRLLAIHEELTGTGPGRRHNVQILNKSAIVLLTAMWEAFVEDLAEAALEFMIDNASDHNAFPPHILERVGGLHNGIKAWDLAGTGWKHALRNNLREVLARTVGTLNTPKTAQVNDLFDKTIGLKNIAGMWRWQGSPSKKVSARLDELVTLRGSIAHRVTAVHNVGKSDVRHAGELIHRIGAISSNAVRAHVIRQIKKPPWGEYHADV